MATTRIGILTGGGDVPGLNGVIKGVTYRALEMGYEVLGIRRGWKGLTHLPPGRTEDAEHLVPLDRENTRTIDRSGGTWLHSSRTNPRKMKASALPPTLDAAEAETMRTGEDRYDITPLVVRNIETLGLDYLIPIGGDDTLSFSRSLHDAGMNVIAVPKTMDNDVQGTEYCIGFSTAVTRARAAVDRQRSTLGSHERIGVFRVFGRDAGFTALYTAFATMTRCVIPEFRYDLARLAQLLAADHAESGSHYAIVITSEGAVWEGGEIGEVGEPDAFGHRHKANVAEVLAAELKARSGIDTINSDLTYDLRAGEPDTVDTIVSKVFANLAVELVAGGERGRMLAIREGRYAHAPLPGQEDTAVSVDASMYDAEQLRPRYDGLMGKPLMVGVLFWMTRSLLFLPALLISLPEIWGGNITILLAAAIVLGFTRPWAWALPLLTKVTPGVGLLWFAVRREWLKLALSLAATVAVIGLVAAVTPGLWQEWYATLTSGTSTSTIPPGAVPIPLLPRLPLAIAVVVVAAWRGERWLLPVGILLAMPVIWWGYVAILTASIALKRSDIEDRFDDLVLALSDFFARRLGAGATASST